VQRFIVFLLISILTVLLAMNFPVLWPLAFVAIGLTVLDGILAVIGGTFKAMFGYLKEISPDDDDDQEEKFSSLWACIRHWWNANKGPRS